MEDERAQIVFTFNSAMGLIRILRIPFVARTKFGGSSLAVCPDESWPLIESIKTEETFGTPVQDSRFPREYSSISMKRGAGPVIKKDINTSLAGVPGGFQLVQFTFEIPKCE
ncbi:hypothetical protein Zmor_003083 [Zophobas morio]|uniref:Uncharacterized protein n=1 Tax=Zophobas morio TaxID=2755281 RepID=A0AA38M2D2_9CUCU|nr:hypothetical protein Zmor_003083 [Zophobas morio]